MPQLVTSRGDGKTWSALHRAVHDGLALRVRELLAGSEREAIEQKIDGGFTPLLFAAHCGRDDCIFEVPPPPHKQNTWTIAARAHVFFTLLALRLVRMILIECKISALRMELGEVVDNVPRRLTLVSYARQPGDRQALLAILLVIYFFSSTPFPKSC